ncbi:hypothetical protein DFH07DRAFT_759290 [Mycena maculata]|uniref:Uncharacterized protein n=1 Tax=Mycena maculata TaxID=230809 RepID=A0AAD7HM69_9AGAR|nr:hypothetical protein DFH07DRAFT_759290 [Mycena maculata]
MRRVTTIGAIPKLLIVAVSKEDLLLEDKLQFKEGAHQVTLHLRGLIYYHRRHFTSVVIEKDGMMWCHDGITTKCKCLRIGYFKDVRDVRTLHDLRGERLSAVIYAESGG